MDELNHIYKPKEDGSGMEPACVRRSKKEMRNADSGICTDCMAQTEEDLAVARFSLCIWEYGLF